MAAMSFNHMMLSDLMNDVFHAEAMSSSVV